MKSDLEKHSETKTHGDNMKILAEQKKLKNSMAAYQQSCGDMAVAVLESRISIFIAENNLAICLADKLVPFLKVLSPQDRVVAKIACARQKTGSIIRQGCVRKFKNIAWFNFLYFPLRTWRLFV